MGHDKKFPTENCTFVVIEIADRALHYSGNSVLEAAEALMPGTCFGYGPAEKDALRMACRIAQRCENNEIARRLSSGKVA